MLSFNKLRIELVENFRMIGIFEQANKTVLYADASPFGIGAVLFQYTYIFFLF